MPRIGSSGVSGTGSLTPASAAAANKDKEKDAQQGNGYHANAAPSGVHPGDRMAAKRFNLQDIAGKMQDVDLSNF